MNPNNLPKIYLFLIIVFTILSGINPVNFQAWFGEAILVAIAVTALTLTYKRFKFSNLSYTLIFIFLLFPLIGGHYTYSSIELSPIKELLGFERNNLDRIVHFLSGLLLVIPTRELLVRKTNVKGFWSYFIPINIILAFGAFYEILEWLVVGIMDPQAGIDFLGAQSDIWDAQKDMALELLGSVISMFLAYTKNWKNGR